MYRLERVSAPLVTGFVVVAAALAVMLAPPARSASMTMASMDMTMTGMSMKMTGSQPAKKLSAESLQTRFDYLSQQITNSCMITPAALAAMPATMRLQGACCSKMGYADYARQIPALASYNREHGTGGLIPSDPYNWSVAFVRKLTAFNDTILLSNAQQKIYTDAFKYAADKAPCCCHCYRWNAFEGQAKDLIAERRYTAREIAAVWNLEDGCGSGNMGPGM
jgi:hypothetical protein